MRSSRSIQSSQGKEMLKLKLFFLLLRFRLYYGIFQWKWIICVSWYHSLFTGHCWRQAESIGWWWSPGTVRGSLPVWSSSLAKFSTPCGYIKSYEKFTEKRVGKRQTSLPKLSPPEMQGPTAPPTSIPLWTDLWPAKVERDMRIERCNAELPLAPEGQVTGVAVAGPSLPIWIIQRLDIW